MEFKINRIELAKGASKRGPKDAGVQYFSGDYFDKIDILVRETIQNPLDNPSNNGKPIRIKFKQDYINVSEIPCKNELLETMNALYKSIESYKKSEKGIADEFTEYYKNAVNTLKGKQIGILQISDYNTTGLIGRRDDMNSNIGRFLGGVGWWDDSSTGGGSGGLGKFAPFKFSELNFCFYSSYNTLKEFIYYGWGNNFTHKINNIEYSGEINIGDSDFDVLKLKKPIESSFLSQRKELGTDVFVLGFIKPDQENYDWKKEMTKAVIRNFFGSIIDEKLEIEICEYNKDPIFIKKSTIQDFLKYFDVDNKKTKNNVLSDILVVEAVETYINGVVFVSDDNETPILGKCIFKMLVNDELSRHVTFLRGPRMLIFNRKIIKGDMPFSGVFICDSEKGNNILRRLEDSHHKAWKYDKYDDKKVQKEINLFLDKCINENATFSNPDEFSINNSSLLSIGGGSRNNSGDQPSEMANTETALIYPENIKVNSKIKKEDFGGEYKVNRKGDKKKVDTKKQKYAPPNNENNKPKKVSENKRKYTAEDFKALIFKNDDISNEYHLFIFSDITYSIRSISFEIPLDKSGSIADIEFINSISDKNGNNLIRDNKKEHGKNSFLDFNLEIGSNQFVVKTKFDKKVQILIK
jgi:hypothetical protein